MFGDLRNIVRKSQIKDEFITIIPSGRYQTIANLTIVGVAITSG
jgi:hypothetical protein